VSSPSRNKSTPARNLLVGRIDTMDVRHDSLAKKNGVRSPLRTWAGTFEVEPLFRPNACQMLEPCRQAHEHERRAFDLLLVEFPRATNSLLLSLTPIAL